MLSAILAVVAAGAFVLYKTQSLTAVSVVSYGLFSLSAAAFLFVGVYFARKIGVFRIFAPVGAISYALYLLHEQVLTLLEGRLEWRIAVAVFVGLFVISAVFSGLCNLLIYYNKKLRHSRSAHLKGSVR